MKPVVTDRVDYNNRNYTKASYSDDDKKAILHYLNKFQSIAVAPTKVFDYFKDEIVSNKSVEGYSDGEYGWDDIDIYYIDKYNLAVTEDFKNKIIERR